MPDIEYLQLGSTFLIALGLIEIIKLLINKYLTRNGGNDNGKKVTEKDENQDTAISENAKYIAVMSEKINKIENNHLPHILHEEEKNRDEHMNIMAKLINIEAKIDAKRNL